jgi:hypothetical protein
MPQLTRDEVIACLSRHERPYQGWWDDYPDLRDEYYRRLSPQQQAMVDWFNNMDPADFERFKSIYHAV